MAVDRERFDRLMSAIDPDAPLGFRILTALFIITSIRDRRSHFRVKTANADLPA